MLLLDLPPELLDEVILCTLPNGFEAFALTCKGVYRRASRHCARHAALKARWRTTSNITLRNGYPNTFSLLLGIAQDPVAAEYIEQLDLWDFPLEDAATDEGEGDTSDDDRWRAYPTAKAQVEAMVMHSPLLMEAASVDIPLWWHFMQKEDDHALLGTMDAASEQLYPSFTNVFFLTLLPNLKVLRVTPDFELNELGYLERDSKALQSVLDLLGQRANTVPREWEVREESLAKLETVLPFMPEGYESRSSLQSLAPFMRLPSLRNIFAISSIAVEDDTYTGFPFHWPYSTPAAALQRIELAYSCVDADGLSHLLPHTPNLSVFRYSHQTKWHGLQHAWNAGTFIEMLARHCGPRITDLAITIDELHGDILNGASSFLFFPNLASLEVSTRIFYGPPVESGQDRDRWTEDDIPCIGSMLPASVEIVELNTDFPSVNAKALTFLLKNVKEEKARRLKKLEEIVVREWNGDDARSHVEEAGATVRLEEFTGEADSRRDYSLMPKWKRAFREMVGGIEWA